jgi:very-short-patch-repair endonuclease
LLLLAKEMRKYPTLAEEVLWVELRRKKLGGHKFRRQDVIDRFIVDFSCRKQRIVIEIDGPVHRNQVSYDHFRTERLHDLGYTVLRFSKHSVLHNIENVKQQILNHCQN